jgi:hypothetical protein
MSVERRYSLIRHEHTIQDFEDWGLLGTTADWWGKLTNHKEPIWKQHSLY